MKKRLLILFTTMTTATASFADTGLSGLNDAADGIGGYLPFVQGLCYVIAAAIGIVGALSVYASMQTAPQQTSKRIMITVGSCMCFIFLSTVLPQFFAIESAGQSSSGSDGSASSASSGDGFLASNEGGISQSGINTDIPPIQDRSGNWITFGSGTNMTIANLVMNVYDHMGSGVDGTYGRTMDYFHEEWSLGNIDTQTFGQIMDIAGNLPHN